MASLEIFSQDDVNAVFRVILAGLKFRDDLKPCNDQPTAYLLSGQPGAGKTVLSSYIAGLYNGNVVLLNGDEYRRYHPNYRELYEAYGVDSVKMTSPFSSTVTEKCIDELSDKRYNLIIEGTGRTYDVPKKTAKQLAPKGYSVEIAVIAVRPEVSLLSTLKRFFAMATDGTTPRATAIEAHDIVVKKLPGNLNKLLETPTISRIRILDRDASLVYDSSESDITPGDALIGYWSQPWNDRELQAMLKDIEYLEGIEAAKNLGMGANITELKNRVSRRTYS